MTLPLLTVGFAFSSDLSKVVVILKNRPEHLAGLFCGPGGMFEAEKNDRNLFDCQVREFEEETGVKTTANEWFYMEDFINPKNKAISAFCAYGDKFLGAATCTDEEIFVMDVSDILQKPNLAHGFADLMTKALDTAYPKTDYQSYLTQYQLAG